MFSASQKNSYPKRGVMLYLVSIAEDAQQIEEEVDEVEI